MSTLEPGSPDDLFRTLEKELGPVDTSDVIDVRSLQNHELGPLVAECDKKLSQMGQLHSPTPTTDEARELHSRRGALLVEMSRRGLR